jgi:hypothetical protein
VRTPGRGGNRHKLLQQAIKLLANGLGLRATIEAALAENEGSVDVLVEGQSLKIAFEVADSRPLEQEVRNIEKALGCGIDSTIVVLETTGHLAQIRQEAEARGISVARATFLESSALGGYFASLGAISASYETAAPRISDISFSVSSTSTIRTRQGRIGDDGQSSNEQGGSVENHDSEEAPT